MVYSFFSRGGETLGLYMPVDSGKPFKTHRLTLSAERIKTGTVRVISYQNMTGLIKDI